MVLRITGGFGREEEVSRQLVGMAGCPFAIRDYAGLRETDRPIFAPQPLVRGVVPAFDGSTSGGEVGVKATRFLGSASQ